jgi:hypothetical protein
VQADFVPEGEEDAFQADDQEADRDPSTGVARDFIPQGDAKSHEGEAADQTANRRQALKNAVDGDAAAQADETAPQKFQGPTQDQLGRREPVEQEPEGRTALEREADAAQGRDPEEAPDRVGDGSAATADDGLVVDGGGGATPVEEVVEDDDSDE